MTEYHRNKQLSMYRELSLHKSMANDSSGDISAALLLELVLAFFLTMATVVIEFHVPHHSTA